jgi:hypothetical protein
MLGIRPLLIDKMIPSSKLFCTDNYGIAMRWLRAVLKLLLYHGCNLKQKKEGSPGSLDNKEPNSAEQGIGTVPRNT